MTIVSLLERFGGYTLQTLMDEDAALLQMTRLADHENARLRETRGDDHDQ
jgi:hypothetical protein